jgi:SPX domain protein involved in polyphosphate accumulation
MKFGKQFDFHKIPEWSENYLDYENLKNELKTLAKIMREGNYSTNYRDQKIEGHEHSKNPSIRNSLSKGECDDK